MAIRLAEDLARELEDLDLPLRPGAAGPGLLQLLFDAAQLLVRRSAAQPALEPLKFPLRQRELLLPLLRFGLKALDRRGLEQPEALRPVLFPVPQAIGPDLRRPMAARAQDEGRPCQCRRGDQGRGAPGDLVDPHQQYAEEAADERSEREPAQPGARRRRTA